MAAIPYIPLYISDYLADTAHLTTEEHGAYLLLIFCYWQRGKPLPAAPEKLANIARLPLERWQIVAAALQEFFRESDGAWVHVRVERDLEHFREKTGICSRAGKVSAAQRKINEGSPKVRSAINRRSTDVQQTFNGRSTDVQQTLQRNGNGRSTDVEQTFNHSDTDTDTDLVRLHTATDVAIVADAKPDIKQAFEEDWPKFWIRVGKGAALAAYQKARKKVSREVLMAAVESQGPTLLGQAASSDRTPIHPATWLNQGRWADEPTTIPVIGKKTASTRVDLPAAPIAPEEDERIAKEFEQLFGKRVEEWGRA